MLLCPDCHQDNPEQFRLCGYCGAVLLRPGGGSGGSSPGVSTGSKAELRKTVTVVFCDLRGSTNLAERLDSEALREVLGAYFSAMRQVIERYGGTVEKYIGDAIMAVFGLPTLHEDDALRAVRAAFDMGAALRSVNVRLQATWGVTLENRTGVNTGQVVAGDVTARQRMATGDAVNVAARLEQAAPVGEVLIGETTFLLVKDAVLAEPVEPLELKGKSGRVPAYRLTGIKGSEAVRRRQDLPVVGREAEMTLLVDAFERGPARSACAAVTVLGQAGLGKTRLVDDFVRWVGDRAQVVRGRCLSYGEGITFWPLAEALREAAGILPDDREDDARAKLSSVAGPERQDAAVRVGSLMGLSSGSYSKDELLWSVRALFAAMAGRRPLVVVFDDVQWAEHVFLDVIEHVADTSDRVPLLVVCAARPELLDERSAFLAGCAQASRIDLADLSRADAAAVIGNLAGGLRLPASLEDRILTAAGGNPLFVEQMIASLIDAGVIYESDTGWDIAAGYEEVIVPPSVSSLLASRLDRLPTAERAVLERAAVIGLDFQPGAIDALSADAEAAADLGPALSALCDKRLIRVTDAGRDDQYQFINLLVRDAAYDHLLKRTRARMHERFADWLLRASGDRVAELEEIIGYHLEQSFRYRAELGPVHEQARSLGDRAARHLGVAGAKAVGHGDMPAAASLFQRGAALLEEGHKDRPRFLLHAGEALGDTGDLAAAQAALDQALAGAARLRNDAIAEARAAELAGLQLRYTTGTAQAHDGVVTRAGELIAGLEEAGDYGGLARAWLLLTFAHWTANQYGRAAEAADRMIRYATQAGDDLTARRYAGSLAMSALFGPTPVGEAIAYCENVLARVTDDRKATAITEVTLAHLEAMRGNFSEGRIRYQRSRAVLEEFGWRLTAALTSLDSAVVEMLAGNLDAAEAELRKDYQTLDQMGERNYISTTAGVLAEVLYRQGRLAEAAEFAQTCRELASSDDVSSQFLWRCVDAKLRARDGAHERADVLIGEALELIGDSDFLDLQGNGFMDLAEVCRLRGDTGQALDALARASECFEAKGNIVSAQSAAAAAADLRAAAGRQAS
jgi:class 3 adenylate cyclase/tetratricopeptide (TPR) repeat protein